MTESLLLPSASMNPARFLSFHSSSSLFPLYFFFSFSCRCVSAHGRHSCTGFLFCIGARFKHVVRRSKIKIEILEQNRKRRQMCRLLVTFGSCIGVVLRRYFRQFLLFVLCVCACVHLCGLRSTFFVLLYLRVRVGCLPF